MTTHIRGGLPATTVRRTVAAVQYLAGGRVDVEFLHLSRHSLVIGVGRTELRGSGPLR